MGLRKLHFLAVVTEAGLVNGRAELSMASLKDLVSSINDISPSPSALKDFDSLCQIVMYFDSDGYNDNEDRRNDDLKRLRAIKERCLQRIA